MAGTTAVRWGGQRLSNPDFERGAGLRPLDIIQTSAWALGFAAETIVLLCAALWMIFQRRIRAIRSLMHHAQEIAEGKLDTVIEVRNEDEIGRDCL